MAVHKLIVIETLRSLGKPGLAGALLLLASLAYALAAVLPAQHELARVQQQATRAEAALAGVRSGRDAPPLTMEKRRDAFYRALPAQGDVTQWIERIYDAAAAEQLSLGRGEYAQTAIADTRLVRYRIVLPIHGGYRQIRRFIATAQTDVPSLSLDDISLQRQSVAEAEIEARIQFSLYLVKPR
jgi:Tfp pilus assembly protein PilO